MAYPYIASWLPFLDSTRICSVYDYKFERTPNHLSDEQLDSFRWSYDDIASNAIGKLEKRRKDRKESDTAQKTDLYQQLREDAEGGEDQLITEFWDEAHKVPDWVDWGAIARGQDIMYRYVGPAWFALNFCSLLGGMGSARVVETLSRTGGFSTRVAKKRIFETSQFVMQCTENISSLKPGGSGHIAALRVRLLHATVRARILSLTKHDPSYYNTATFGIPINDQDSIGTILAFSANLIFIAFPLQGIFLRRQEMEDYNALWRLIAHYMGVPTFPFETPETSKVWMESIIDAEIKPSEKSKILANNIITCVAEQAPFYASADYLRAQTYWLNGPKLSAALGIPKPSVSAVAMMFVRTFGVAVSSFAMRSIPVLDRWNIKHSRAFMHGSIIMGEDGMNGKLSTFSFKYIPRYGKSTEQGIAGPVRGFWHEKSLERNIVGWFGLLVIVFGIVFGVGTNISRGLVAGLKTVS